MNSQPAQRVTKLLLTAMLILNGVVPFRVLPALAAPALPSTIASPQLPDAPHAASDITLTTALPLVTPEGRVQDTAPAAPTVNHVVNCLSTIVVLNNADSGAGSFSQAMSDICDGGTITFNGNYTPTLTSAMLTGKNVTLDGLGHTITLVGPDSANNWNLTGTDAGSLGHIAWVHIVNLRGGNNTDAFDLSAFTGTVALDGNGGTNTVVATRDADFTLSNNALLAANVLTATLTNISVANLTGGVGANTFALSGWTYTATFDGAGGSDGLVGDNVMTTWNITGTNAGNVNGTVAFTAIENLTGLSGADNFVFAAGAVIEGAIHGGPGSDLLDYSAYTTLVTVNLAAQSATGTHGVYEIENITGGSAGDMLTGDNNANVITVISTQNSTMASGGGGNDTLIGPDTANTWHLTGSNSGDIAGTVAFFFIENLTGGTQDDVFVFSDGASVAGTIDGGAHVTGDVLDYTAYTTSVVVDLVAGTATGTGQITRIEKVVGLDSATALTSSPNPSTVGQAVTFTATVTATSGTPTGTVQLYDNGVALGAPLTLSGGQAVTSTSALSVGTHPITVTYSGDASYLASTSSIYTQTVTIPPIVYAKPSGLTSGACESWANACELRYAITSTISGQEIWVAAGTYKPTASTTYRAATFQLKSGVAVYGGFAGTEITRTQRITGTNLTVLSGDIDNNDITDAYGVVTTTANITGRNSYHVVTGATGATLDGVIITAGNANGGYPNDSGGGMYNYISNPTLTNIAFSGNSASLGGGGMYNNSSSPTLTNVTFSGNSASIDGGGMYNSYSSNPTLTNVIFSGNSAFIGGGMYNEDSSPTLTNVTFSGNSASTRGGGMYNSSSSPTLTNVTFSGNSANGDIYGGGGMYNSYSSPTLTNVTFIGNSATRDGGGMYNFASNPSIRNSIFWGDTGGEFYNASGVSTLTDSVVQGGCPSVSTCTNIITANPLLGTLGNYGGSTQTFPLLPGSSAIEAASANCPATDQRGVPRGTTCDIGAFESRGFTLTKTGGDSQATLVYQAFATPLGLNVTSAYSEPVNGGIVTFVGPLSGASTNPITNTATITNGAASQSVTANSTSGSYNVTASVSGASSSNFTLTNNKASTTTSVTSSPNPSSYGQSVTFTATVTATNGTPTGSVQFYADGATLGSPVTLSSGKAVTTISTLSVGTHPITATYSGDANNSPSVSGLRLQAVYARPAVSAGGNHTCGLKADGTLQCWGWNFEGQTNVPSPNANWVQVSAKGQNTCGLKADGTLQCWGNNILGQTDVPSPNTNWVQVTVGGASACGLKADGTLQCWGRNDNGQATVPTPNANWVQVTAGAYHTCGMKADGTLQCWGWNDAGQTDVPSPNANWVQVSAGWNHACGMKADGTLQCWGENILGQTDVPSPNANWVQVSSGYAHTCGMKADGTLQCWGWNDDGQTDVPSPNVNWVQVSANGYHTCGMKMDGTLRCWGRNDHGQAPVLSLSPSTLANAAVGLAYTQTITATATTGATPPYRILVISGTVPTGLTLNANGTWSGTPTSTGTFSFTAQAADANNIAGTRNYSVTATASTTTTVTSSPNSSTYGQSVTLTATVTSIVGTPTGSIQFYDNGATLGSPITLSSGKAITTTSTLAIGTHPITATYSGDGTYNASSGTLSGGQVITDALITGLSASNSSPTRLTDATFFTATIGAGSNVTYQWNFGDGQTASGATTNHTYAATGSYTATVTATNSVGSVSASTLVTITNQRPVANAGPDQSASVNALVTLNGTGSNDPDNHLPLMYGWTQSGGTAVALSSATSSQPTFTAPSAPAVLTFTLNVTDAQGLPNLASDSVVITIGDVAITGLSATNSSPTRLTDVTFFTATIGAGSNVTYQWNFGDGQTTSGATANHTYAATGNYTASVTATNGAGSVGASTLVTLTNQQPIANAGPDQSVLVSANVTLAGSSSTDPDGHLPLTYGWAQSGGTPVVLSSAVISRPTFSAPSVPAVLTFTLTVMDGQGATSVPDEVVVLVDDQSLTDLTASNDSPTRIGTVTHLMAAIANGSNALYAWNFGDGQTGAGAQINHRYAQTGSYTAIVTATNGAGSITATTRVTLENATLYLPLVVNRYAAAPDLIVRNLNVTDNRVQVVIQNQGDAPVVEEFWVDVYINPTSAPTGVNQTWSMLGTQGLVWGVTASALPALMPGGELTLTVNDAYFFSDFSTVTWPLPVGTTLYAQVDSVDLATMYGAVLEKHELLGLPYNNLYGPLTLATSVTEPAGPAALPNALPQHLSQRP